MSRHHISEPRALIQNVVPRHREAPILRPVFQEQIRYHPGPILKLSDMRRWILSIRPYYVSSQKRWRSEDHLIRVKSKGISAVVIECDYIHAFSSIRIGRIDLRHR